MYSPWEPRLQKLVYYCINLWFTDIIFPQQFQGKYLFGPTITSNRYHVAIVRNQLTRNIGRFFDVIREEGELAIAENISVKNGERYV